MDKSIDFATLTGKRIAIIAVGKDEKGDTEAAVWTGVGRFDQGRLYLDREEGKSFEFPNDVLGRIKPVPDSISDIVLHAEYYITMSIGTLPEGADPSEYKDTGLKWPK
jgi:hypothetical protein